MSFCLLLFTMSRYTEYLPFNHHPNTLMLAPEIGCGRNWLICLTLALVSSESLLTKKCHLQVWMSTDCSYITICCLLMQSFCWICFRRKREESISIMMLAPTTVLVIRIHPVLWPMAWGHGQVVMAQTDLPPDPMGRRLKEQLLHAVHHHSMTIWLNLGSLAGIAPTEVATRVHQDLTTVHQMKMIIALLLNYSGNCSLMFLVCCVLVFWHSLFLLVNHGSQI